MDFPVDKWKALPKEERDRVFDMLMDASDQGAGRKKDAAKRKNVKREFPKGLLFALLAILAVGVVFLLYIQ